MYVNSFSYAGQVIDGPKLIQSDNGKSRVLFIVKATNQETKTTSSIECVAFGKSAEIAMDKLFTGCLCFLMGSISSKDNEKDGKVYRNTNFIANYIELIK